MMTLLLIKSLMRTCAGTATQDDLEAWIAEAAEQRTEQHRPNENGE